MVNMTCGYYHDNTHVEIVRRLVSGESAADIAVELKHSSTWISKIVYVNVWHLPRRYRQRCWNVPALRDKATILLSHWYMRSKMFSPE